MSSNRAPNNHVFYRNQDWHYPKITRGEGIYLYDDHGNEYLDGCSGSSVCNIGHGNKEVAEFAKEQIETIAFTHLSRFTADPIEQCAEKVSNWTPDSLNHIYFVSGGSEGTETAIKMARQYYVERDGRNSSKSLIISKWNSYHGNTLGALSVTGLSGRRTIYNPMLVDFPKIHQFYHYRNPWDSKTKKRTSIKAAQELEEAINRIGPEHICAFISEPIVGSAAPGIHPEKIYFDMVREICDKYDILLIIDEVMSGFGRTASKFGIDHYNLEPDLMIMAKGMSCGYTPIGAVAVSREIFDTIMVKGSGQFIHGHTYAGNPLSCGIANKVMEIIERDKLINLAKKNSKHFTKRLKEFNAYDFVGEIRGLGYMQGIEFVKNKTTKESFDTKTKFSKRIMEACLKEGLVIYPGSGSVNGVIGDHVLLTPPINITVSEIDLFIDKMHRGFNNIKL